jgi:hypothetical protein
MTIEELSWEIKSVVAKCKTLTGSIDLSSSFLGLDVQIHDIAKFANIDAEVVITAPMPSYRLTKTVGGVDYFILARPEELGIKIPAVEEKIARYLEGLKRGE